jgi:hypothetical protein
MKKISLGAVLATLVMTFVLCIGVLGLPHGASAQSSGGSQLNFKLDNPIDGSGDLPAFVTTIANGLVILLTPLVVIMVLYSGFLFVTAKGNVEKLGTAKQALLYTLIGAAIVLGAQGFATIIQNTVGCLGGGTGC